MELAFRRLLLWKEDEDLRIDGEFLRGLFQPEGAEGPTRKVLRRKPRYIHC
jgi:hypothetical protein